MLGPEAETETASLWGVAGGWVIMPCRRIGALSCSTQSPSKQGSCSQWGHSELHPYAVAGVGTVLFVQLEIGVIDVRNGNNSINCYVIILN